MPSYVDQLSQRRGLRGVLEDALILLTEDTVLNGRCQRPTFVSERATTQIFGRVCSVQVIVLRRCLVCLTVSPVVLPTWMRVVICN